MYSPSQLRAMRGAGRPQNLHVRDDVANCLLKLPMARLSVSCVVPSPLDHQTVEVHCHSQNGDHVFPVKSQHPLWMWVMPIGDRVRFVEKCLMMIGIR